MDIEHHSRDNIFGFWHGYMYMYMASFCPRLYTFNRMDQNVSYVIKVLNIQSTLVISKSKGPSKHFEISVLRHIRFVVLRKKQFQQPNFTNDYVI